MKPTVYRLTAGCLSRCILLQLLVDAGKSSQLLSVAFDVRHVYDYCGPFLSFANGKYNDRLLGNVWENIQHVASRMHVVARSTGAM